MAEPRLLVQADLVASTDVAVTPAQAHYLQRVMRLGPGDSARLFNGRDGEWRAILSLRGRDVLLRPVEQLRAQAVEPGPLLAFAPIRRQRAEWLVEKAVELGASSLQPVRTRRAEAGLGSLRRLEAIIVEAAEQCGRLEVPPLLAEIDLGGFLKACVRSVVVLDPTAPVPLADVLEAATPPALLIGPEGGFDPGELSATPPAAALVRARLGPTILRAETAAIAALAVWRSVHDRTAR